MDKIEFENATYCGDCLVPITECNHKEEYK